MKRIIMLVLLGICFSNAFAIENEGTWRTVGPFIGLSVEHAADPHSRLLGIAAGVDFNTSDWFWGKVLGTYNQDKVRTVALLAGTKLYASTRINVFPGSLKTAFGFQGGLNVVFDGYNKNVAGAIVMLTISGVYPRHKTIQHSKSINDLWTAGYIRPGSRANDGPEIGLLLGWSHRKIKKRLNGFDYVPLDPSDKSDKKEDAGLRGLSKKQRKLIKVSADSVYKATLDSINAEPAEPVAAPSDSVIGRIGKPLLFHDLLKEKLQLLGSNAPRQNDPAFKTLCDSLWQVVAKNDSLIAIILQQEQVMDDFVRSEIDSLLDESFNAREAAQSTLINTPPPAPQKTQEEDQKKPRVVKRTMKQSSPPKEEEKKQEKEFDF